MTLLSLALKIVPNTYRKRLFKSYVSMARYFKFKYVQSYYGPQFYNNWEDATYRFYIDATYGNDLRNYLSDYKNKFAFIDVGANQGLFSMLALDNQHCEHVYAYEPVNQTYAFLEKNVAKNAGVGMVTLFKAAISASSGITKIAKNPSHSGMATLARSDETVSEHEEITTHNHVDIDAFISTKSDIILKVDVEGHEGVVIEQILKSKIRGQIVAVFYEVDENWTDPEIIKAQLVMEGGFSSFLKLADGDHYDVLATKTPITFSDLRY